MNKGKLIVIEGTDGSGKETQSKLLRERICGELGACGYFSFPRYDTPTGMIIKRYLGKHPFQQEFGSANSVDPKIASTWYALDRWHATPEIRSLVSKGINGVLNRWVESNMAHQGGKIRDPQKKDEMISWLERLEYGSLQDGGLGIPKANLVVFLYMPHQVATQLREERAVAGEATNRLDGHESDPDHMVNAERTYLELAKRFGWTRVNCAPSGTRESLRTREDIGEEVYGIVRPLIQNT